MTLVSITSIDTFRQRAQRSEHWRTWIMLGVLAILLAIVIARRALRGALMADNRIFTSALAVLLAVTAYEIFVLLRIRRAERAGELLSESFWRINALIELAAPLTLLTAYQVFATEGRVAGLSAPALLVVPIILILSVLRLKPGYTLLLGAIAAAAHLALALVCIARDRPHASFVPIILTYPVLLLVCGGCAALVARVARLHLREAINETIATEAARQRIAGMEYDLSVARDIQRGLIPAESPRLPGFDIAGCSRPADLTGGDYYDWQTLPDGRVIVVMADVTGHGIGPALVMAICRAYARAIGPILPTLAAILQRLNRLIHDDVQGQRFITLVVGLFDANSPTAQLLSAGHGPTLLYRARDGTVERFDGDGMPLGIVADEQYGAAREVRIDAGDVMLMMTDGYFERQRASDNKQFGIARVEEVLRAHASAADAATILQRLDEAVGDFGEGAPQTDDMTAVVIRRRSN